MLENTLRKLRSHRQSLVGQDAILADAMQAQGNCAVPVAGIAPINRIFQQISADFSGLVPTLSYHAQPAALRSQIAEAVARMDAKIHEVECELAREATRDELRVPIRPTRDLTESRLEEGNSILAYPADTPQQLLDQILPWVDRTLQTLRRVFVSDWHANQFAKAVCLSDLSFAMGPDTVLRCVKGGVEVLRSLGEDLYLKEELSPAGDTANKTPGGTKIFIGHGRSSIWRELNDFLADRLHLDCDEYNSEPTAGFFTPERVQVMLDQARFAFLVMTGEDQQPEGTRRARENVVHEAGLFQGRLGFRKAIILLEQGCEPFSNIHGLTVIPFPKDQITAAFEEVRRTLEREHILPSA